jgi:phosphate-selective porin OprO/OprP
MKRLLVAALLASAAHAAAAHDINDWPTYGKTEGGLEYGVRGQFQYDFDEFGNDRLDSGAHRFEDAHDWRRREFGGYLRKAGVFELVMGYDFAIDTWIDNYLKLNAGKAHEFRMGQFKTPVGMDESATSSAATVFLERAAPVNAVYQGRRIGADWTWVPNKQWRLNLGYFTDGDLNGLNEGHTLGGRAVFTPRNGDGEVLHLGLAASREERDDEAARIRTRPEAAITDVRLVDSGTLAGSDAIDRVGLEGAWQHGPWLAQGEWLSAQVHRDGADFSAQGGYLQGSWVLTGEAHPYKGGGFGNPRPSRASGAWELALRYSDLDLDDGLVQGGRQRNWTVGANWYLTPYFKFQANYVHVDGDRQGQSLAPEVFQVRAQLAF